MTKKLLTLTGLAISSLVLAPKTYAGNLPGFVVNHDNVEETIENGDGTQRTQEIIPSTYLDAARNSDILFGHQSVGRVISYGDDNTSNGGLDDLVSMYTNGSRYQINMDGNQPNGLPDTVSANWYVTNNGVGEVLIGDNFNPVSKMEHFVNLLARSDINQNVKLALMKFCYVDFTNYTAAQVWNELPVNVGSTTVYGYRGMMEYLETTYPNINFVWVTAPLTRSNPISGYGTNANRYDYNTLVRNYTAANNKVLFDIADIESHDLSGNYCYNATEREYECDGTLAENYVNGTGHPNTLGASRLSRAFWWLMARASGWNPGSSNYSPVASFTSSVNAALVPATVSFDASASNDPDGNIVSYSWNFGDGSTGSGVTTSHTYTQAGTYQVTLTVTDNAGATGTASTTLTISSENSGTGAFNEIAGQVSIEAEHYHSNQAASNGSWSETTTVAAFSGESYLVTPDNGLWRSEYQLNDSPMVSYEVNFSSPGTYYLWVRTNNPSNTSDSLYFGIDGSRVGAMELSNLNNWGWSRTVRMSSSPASVTIGSAGTHSINIWMREDGATVDKVILTTNASYVPSGSGLAESPRGEVNQLPVASATATPTSGNIPLEVSFDASASNDPDGNIVSYSWNFGDGSTGSGVTTSHTYTQAGSFTATLTVTDNDGGTANHTTSITVVDPNANNQPTASFTQDKTSGVAPVEVNFDGSASTDSDGTITDYSWNFGDGNTGSGVTTSHTYTQAGSYQVTLTVTDDDGATATANLTITVTVPNGTGAFVETAGNVSMEAEHFMSNASTTIGSWNAATALASYTGESYITTTDSNVWRSEYQLNDSPMVSYEINFSTPGTYYLWVRTNNPSGTSDSVHFGLNNARVGTMELSNVGSWGWSRTLRMSSSPASITVSSAGTHTFNIWMREDGTNVDKIILTTNASYTPSGEGIAESSRQ
ncbi:MAG: PKD domain-containing protein [Patescibacteria group bacterium]